MATICAFCLSNDRNLTLIDNKFSKIVDSCVSSEDDELEYLQCLQRKQALQICWECSTKLKNMHQFISTSQQCVRVLNNYLEDSTQILPATTSRLYITHIEIVDISLTYEETETEDMADTIYAGLIYAETKAEAETDTETEEVEDTIDAGVIYEESKIEVTDTEIQNVRDTKDTWLIHEETKTEALTYTETENVGDTIDAKLIYEETKIEDVTDTEIEDVAETLYTGPIFNETETNYVTDTMDVKIENDPLETELDNYNEEVINSYIREDPCISEDLEMIKEQVVWWRVILYRLPTDTLPANIISSDAPVTVCDSTNNSLIKTLKDISRVEAPYEVTDCILNQHTTKKNEYNISKKDKVINKTKTVFKITKQRKGAPLNYICDHCKQIFYTKLKLQQHISIHYRVSELNLTCATCNYKGVTVQALEKHSRLHDKKRRFKCNSCTYRFSSNHHLMQHISTHTGEKPYKCDMCEYESIKSSNLKKHLKTHSGEKPFKCNLCDYTCSECYSLKIHIKRHTGEKTYKCDLCDYTSVTSHLKTHMVVHTGEKPYKCHLCDYAGRARSHLRAHIRKHTGEKPFKCYMCDYASSKSSDMKKHIRRNHMGHKPYKCDMCDYASSVSAYLKKHIMRIHNERDVVLKRSFKDT